MRCFFAVLIVLLLFTGCSVQKSQQGKYEKYTYEFIGAFDTVIQFMGYAQSEQDFNGMTQKGQSRFEELNKLYDIYNDYEGVNNIKTINDNAGIKPVEVKQDIIDLLNFAKEWYKKTDGTVNVVLGPVLSIWHDYREEGINNPGSARLPDIESLKNAAQNTDISNLEVDNAKGTVFLREKGMSLDVGAVAKGFAAEIVAKELSDDGYTSFIISAGGNVRVVGKPMDGMRSKWGIGVQDPDKNAEIPDTTSLDTIYMTDGSVVSSGDYERYFEVNGKRYHHLIDPATLMPADFFRQITIVTENSGIADALSTAVFVLPYEKGRALVESLDGVDALWVMQDRSIRVTENLEKMLKNMGGATNQ